MDPISLSIEAAITGTHALLHPVSKWFSKKFRAPVLEEAKELICEFQALIIQNSYLLGEKHKRLRKALERYHSAHPQNPSPSLLREIKTTKDDISNDCKVVLRAACKHATTELYRYFERRHKVRPRICIKILSKNSSGAFVMRTYYQAATQHSTKYEHTVRANSAAYRICVNRENYYFCNDIPRSVKITETDQYTNERLNLDAAQKYAPSRWKRLMLALGSPSDTQWVACWKPTNGTPPTPEACFKSTLVVPIALRNQVSEDFTNSLQGKIQENSLQVSFLGADFDTEETGFDPVFGLLCLDHVTAGYFDKSCDPYYSFILADLISIFLWFRCMYVEASHVYNEAEAILKTTECTTPTNGG